MEDISLNAENRIFERMSCNFNMQVTKEKNTPVEKAVAYDFSGNGFGFNTKMALNLSDTVELGIFYALGKEPMRQEGKVIRAEKMESGEWNIGVEFSSYAIAKFIPLMAAMKKSRKLDN